MAVVRRYRRDKAVTDEDLADALGPAFLASVDPRPGEMVDITADEGVPNYAEDIDQVMSSFGFSFVGEDLPTQLDFDAADEVPPIRKIRTPDGPSPLVTEVLDIGAIADGQYLRRDGSEVKGSDLDYTPSEPGDWDDPDPTDVPGALDDLAERLTAVEDAGVANGNLTTIASLANWEGAADLGQEKVSYFRFYLPVGTYDEIELGIVQEKAGETIDMGVYADDGGSPTPSPTGALLASTGPVLTTGFSNKFFRQPFTADLVISTAGHYWVAVVASKNGITCFSTNHLYNLAWRDRLFAFKTAYGSATLGALAGFDAAAASTLLYLALVEKS